MSKVKEFKKDVMHEVDMLKKHLAKVEKERLDFINLDPRSKFHCVYGQAARGCGSSRARQLIKLCCTKVVENVLNKDYSISHKDFIVSDDFDQLYEDNVRRFSYISALEAYIGTKNAKNESVIAYIKGEISEITL